MSHSSLLPGALGADDHRAQFSLLEFRKKQKMSVNATSVTGFGRGNAHLFLNIRGKKFLFREEIVSWRGELSWWSDDDARPWRPRHQG